MQNYRSMSSAILIVAFGDTILGVDARSGKRVWQKTGGTFLVEGDLIFVGSSGNVWCHSTANGELLWTDSYEGLGSAEPAFGFAGNFAQADQTR
jgi:hypothetical protein